MKRILFSLCALLLVGRVAADEGMWLVHLLEQVYPEMRERGLRLRPEEIFGGSEPSLCDAVVAVDGGLGTGSMISDQGLMITNHHVAFGDICALSTAEHNYREEGFWARSREEELPVKGKTVWFLRDVEEVTAEAQAYRDELQRAGRWGVMGSRKLAGEMERRHAREGLEASCVAMWGGRAYWLFYYEIYTDVRLVGAPPVRIGAFGGETDNWSWPQHKGDFALYRVYGDADGRPAAYSEENVPIRPRRVLSVSTCGIEEGDFAMVIGYPGRTHRYGSSFAAEEKRAVKNPIVERCRHDRMEIIRRRMEADPAVRMAYSDSYFNLSNYADYARWENICLRRYDVRSHRADEEREIERWIAADSARAARYGTLIADLKRGYEARREAVAVRTWFQESWLGPSQALIAANRIASALARRDPADTLRAGDALFDRLAAAGRPLARDYDAQTDRELLVRCVRHFTDNVPRSMWGDRLSAEYDRCAGDAGQLAAEAFDGSFCRDAASYEHRFAEACTVDELLRDPLVALAGSVSIQQFARIVQEAERQAGEEVDSLENRYRRLQYAFREAAGRPQYPDANSTMRLTFGRVKGLAPADGVHCSWRSTPRGYVEKHDPESYDFRVDDRMRGMIDRCEWGRWCPRRGDMTVNFLTDNDITGGNSGSPVLNGRGELVGLAFDGNRESMAGDLWFHPEEARTVSVDIRFVMWVIEKYAGAEGLLSEIRFADRGRQGASPAGRKAGRRGECHSACRR